MGMKKPMGLVVGLAIILAACGDDSSEPAQIETVHGAAETEESLPEPSLPPEQTDGADAGDAEPADDEPPALLLIMDASGSMNGRDDNGERLIDGAQEALVDVVDSLPEEQHVGLRVYGHTYPNTDEVNGCTDTELIHPVGPLDRAALVDSINGFEAKGFTPIGLSLQQGLEDLADVSDDRSRTMILVSDGEETCDTDPCAAAEDVRAAGVELVIHTVGFALGDNEQAREELSCVAATGGGDYVEVDEAGDLADTLEDMSVRDPRGYEVAGGELEGVRIPRDANTGHPNTPYTDVVLGAEVNYYRFEVPAGSQVRGEMILTPDVIDPDEETSLICPNIYVTDESDIVYTGSVLEGSGAQGGAATETYVKHTGEAVVEATEVWIKIDTKGCVHDGPSNSQYDLEVQLTILD